MEVRRVAADLQLAPDDRVGRPGEVDDVQRIDLTERDDVAGLADEADAEDALAAAKTALAAELHELSAALLERRHEALRVGLGTAPPERELGRRHPQHAVELGHRELVDDVARHLSACAVSRAQRIGDVEAVERGRLARRLAVVELALLGPALRRHVEARLRRVDHLTVRHHAVGVDGDEALAQVERDDTQDAEAGEARRTGDVAAAE